MWLCKNLNFCNLPPRSWRSGYAYDYMYDTIKFIIHIFASIAFNNNYSAHRVYLKRLNDYYFNGCSLNV